MIRPWTITRSLSAMSRVQKDRRGEGSILNNLGLAFADWGQYGKAVDCYEKSLDIKRELKDRRGEGSVLNNLGMVFADWGQYDKASAYYEKSLALSRELKDRGGEGNSLMNIGRVLEHRGRRKEAIENFEKGLAIYTEMKIPTRWPKALMADVYLDEGDLAKAEPLLNEVDSYNRWGRFYLAKADYPKAKEFYGKMIQSAEQSRNGNDLFSGYTGTGAACEELNDYPDALENYERAVKLTEDLRSTLSAAERESFFDARINGFFRTAPYEGLARVQMRLNKPQEAFQTTEYTKARVFAEALSRLSGKTTLDMPAEVLNRDHTINNELAALKKNLQKGFEKNNKLVIQSLEPQVRQMEDKLQAHIKMLREKYPLFAATKYPEPMDLTQTDLKDNEWVLAYHVTDPGIIIYLTSGKNLVKGLFKPIPREQVDGLIRKFRQPMEVGPEDSLEKKLISFDFDSGKRLSDLLLSDILSALPKNAPLIIIPDGSLGVVPFEMLVLNDGGKVVTEKQRPQTSGAEFFGDRNPISYYQSITALTLARTLGKQQKPGEKLLAMVDPVFSSDDPRLTQTCQQEKDKLLASSSQRPHSCLSRLRADLPFHGFRLRLSSENP